MTHTIKKIEFLNYLILVVCLFSHCINGQDLGIDQDKLSVKEKRSTINHYIQQSDSLVVLHKEKQAENSLKKAYALSLELNEFEIIKETGFKLEELLFRSLNKNEEAIKLNNSLYELSCNHKDTIGMVTTLNKRGHIKKQELDYLKALEYYNKALNLAKHTNKKRFLWAAHYYIGKVYKDINDREMARKEFMKLPHIKSEINPDNYYILSYINISSTFKNPDSIYYYSSKALSKCTENRNTRRCYLVYNNIAWAYALKGQPEKALEVVQQNINLDNLNPNSIDTLYSSLMHTLGFIYYQLNDQKNAIKYYDLALEGFKKKSSVANIIMTKDDLSKSYEKIGNLEKSLQLLKEIKPLTKELDDIKLKKEIAKLESRKLLEIQEEQIFDLEVENKQIGQAMSNSRKFNYFLIVFLCVILLAILFLQYRNKIKFHALNEELSLNRIKSLRAMMNPHFLFNSFSTLQNYILKKERLKANEYMTELSGLIRNVLLSSDSIYISFVKEIELIKSYISIEQARFEHKFDIFYDIDEDLTDLNPTIPSMVIQPYVENAILHGFSSSDENYKLTLSFKKQHNSIICKVLDNGIGRDKAEILKRENNPHSHLSIATRNTNDRLRILSKIGKGDASVKINDLYDKLSKPIGTEVVIALPLINAK